MINKPRPEDWEWGNYTGIHELLSKTGLTYAQFYRYILSKIPIVMEYRRKKDQEYDESRRNPGIGWEPPKMGKDDFNEFFKNFAKQQFKANQDEARPASSRTPDIVSENKEFNQILKSIQNIKTKMSKHVYIKILLIIHPDKCGNKVNQYKMLEDSKSDFGMEIYGILKSILDFKSGLSEKTEKELKAISVYPISRICADSSSAFKKVYEQK